MMQIGILGGTFDPPHMGHLIIAEEVKNALQLDEIWFIPSYDPPHKNKAMIDANHRINMLQLAIQGNDHFKLNTLEIDRSGISYTVDTIKELKEEYPGYTFYFIIGADMVEYLPKWKHVDELVKLMNFVGVERPGFQVETSYPLLEVDIPVFDISSSFIRERLRNNQTVTYLIPERVNTYIKERRLYEES
ncbi:nicotinate-nucleotide adenylyltransferase [Virgibacillus sp. W0181]|uniref:nicotinate-nucleotide adenylyltransferase n=1 Tax=Virgibacillus sp. W0181 TaxID=3391581 RepID=UPI003F44F3E5